MLHVNELHCEWNTINENRQQIYQELYIICCKKIKIKSNNKKDCLIYEVPQYTIGLPMYNIDHAIYYIIKELRNNGFQVRYFYPTTLLISWINKNTEENANNIKNFQDKERDKTNYLIPYLEKLKVAQITYKTDSN